ncbi:hypothetical protein JYU34_003489 [Plutella xylostella]|uniref:Uncharacterized protein n=1 Tax=Plutella xylostella TaxID=51655 RepID=A0ABQ7R067_PLUXY|nr:hypothetical protein JYU34_003489 [Plutella xylostella]
MRLKLLREYTPPAHKEILHLLSITEPRAMLWLQQRPLLMLWPTLVGLGDRPDY